MSVKFIGVLSYDDNATRNDFFCERFGQGIPLQRPWQIRLESECQRELREVYRAQDEVDAYSLALIKNKLKPHMRKQLGGASLKFYGAHAWRQGVKDPLMLVVDESTASFAFEWLPTENENAALLGETVVIIRFPLDLENKASAPCKNQRRIGCFPLIRDELHTDGRNGVRRVAYLQDTVQYLGTMRDDIERIFGPDVVDMDESPSNMCFAEFPNSPFVHLVFHGPDSKSDRLELPHNVSLSGDDFVKRFVDACKGQEWPQCLVLTVCGAARAITCKHIAHLLKETPLRNILMSPLAIPVEADVFKFYGKLYEGLLGGGAMSSSFREAAQQFPTVGLMHCIWGADHTYVNAAGVQLTEDAEATVNIVKQANDGWQVASKVEGKLIDSVSRLFDPEMIRPGLRVNAKLPPVDKIDDRPVYEEMKSGDNVFFRYRLSVFGGALCLLFPKAQAEAVLEELKPWVFRLSVACAPEPGIASVLCGDTFRPYGNDGDQAFYVLAEDIPASAHALAELRQSDQWKGLGQISRLCIMTQAGEMLCRALHRLQEDDLGVDALTASIRVIVPELSSDPNQTTEASVRGFFADPLIHVIQLDKWKSNDPKDEMNNRLQADGRYRWRSYRVATLRELAQELLCTALNCEGDGIEAALKKLKPDAPDRDAATRLVHLWRQAKTDFDTFDQAAMMLHAPYQSVVEELRTLRRAGRRLFLVQNLHEDAELLDALVAASGGQPRHLAAVREQDWQKWHDMAPPPSPLLIDGMDTASLFSLIANEAGMNRLSDYVCSGGHLIIRDSPDWTEGQQTVELRRLLVQLAQAPAEECPGTVTFCDIGVNYFLGDRILREHLSRLDGDLRSDRDTESALVKDANRAGQTPLTSSQIQGLAREMRGLSRRSARDLSRLLRVKNLLPDSDENEANRRERKRLTEQFIKKEFADSSRVIELIETGEPPAWLGYKDLTAWCEKLAGEIKGGLPLYAAGSAVVVGLPGTDSARIAPWVAAQLGVPCFRLNVVAAMMPDTGVLGGLRFGLQRLGRLQGCVLWVDGFLRTLLRNAEDTYAQRLLGTLLYWLQAEAPAGRILTLATDEVTPPNLAGYERDLKCLGNEFTRDERFNRRFFLKSPSAESTQTIFDDAIVRLFAPAITSLTNYDQARKDVLQRLLELKASPAFIRQTVAEIALNYTTGEENPFAAQLATLPNPVAIPAADYAITGNYTPID